MAAKPLLIILGFLSLAFVKGKSSFFFLLVNNYINIEYSIRYSFIDISNVFLEIFSGWPVESDLRSFRCINNINGSRYKFCLSEIYIKLNSISNSIHYNLFSL